MDYSIEELAYVFVGRWCLLLGIGTVGLELNFALDPVVILKITGACALVGSLGLMVVGLLSPRVPYAQTGLWEMLRPGERPQSEIVAQQLIGSTLRRACLTYAMHAAEASAGLLAASLLA